VTDIAEELAIPSGMRHYELPTREETLDFTGKLIHAEDNDQGDRPRWAELQLYRILHTDPDDEELYGQQGWLLYTVGHTLVYHAEHGCNRGILLPAGDFDEQAEDPEALEPCVRCRPPHLEDTYPDTPLRLEVTWYSYTPSETPDEVYNSLCREAQCKNCQDKPHKTYQCSCGCKDYEPAPRVLSVPGRRLWEQARRLDPDIGKTAPKKVRI
jgi:hypothetical protein